MLGPGAASSAFGIVGQVAGPVDTASPLVVEVRAGGQSVRLPIDDVRHDAVPEETFAGLAVAGTPTPAALAAVVGVARASAVPPAPDVSLGYRHARMTGNSAVSVVVPVYREYTYLRNLVRALADANDGVELTVVCDDPQLAGDLVAWVRAWNEPVYDVPMQVLVHDRNAGFAAACNTGWRSGRGELVVLLNSDVLVADPSTDLVRLAAGMAADVAAATPSAAAELLFPDIREIRSSLRRTMRLASSRTQIVGQRWPHRLERLSERLGGLVEKRLGEQSQTLQSRIALLNSSIEKALSRANSRISVMHARLLSLSPLGVLSRGYCICETEAHRRIRSLSELRSGERIVVRFVEGSVCATTDPRTEPDA